jgi:hypothetical protein
VFMFRRHVSMPSPAARALSWASLASAMNPTRST